MYVTYCKNIQVALYRQDIDAGSKELQYLLKVEALNLDFATKLPLQNVGNVVNSYWCRNSRQITKFLSVIRVSRKA